MCVRERERERERGGERGGREGKGEIYNGCEDKEREIWSLTDCFNPLYV